MEFTNIQGPKKDKKNHKGHRWAKPEKIKMDSTSENLKMLLPFQLTAHTGEPITWDTSWFSMLNLIISTGQNPSNFL